MFLGLKMKPGRRLSQSKSLRRSKSPKLSPRMKMIMKVITRLEQTMPVLWSLLLRKRGRNVRGKRPTKKLRKRWAVIIFWGPSMSDCDIFSKETNTKNHQNQRNKRVKKLRKKKKKKVGLPSWKIFPGSKLFCLYFFIQTLLFCLNRIYGLFLSLSCCLIQMSLYFWAAPIF